MKKPQIDFSFKVGAVDMMNIGIYLSIYIFIYLSI
jgi:hypothetical protein